jgi:UDP-glucose 4-epimerase
MRILITGGAGYIGSHTAVEALREGHDVVILDSFINSDRSAVENIEKASGKKVDLVECDLSLPMHMVFEKLDSLDPNFDSVIHFAALKSSPESVSNPIEYYDNNLKSLLNILKFCKIRNVKNFIFSSSATVYGDPQFLPITEEHPIGKGTTPYGSSKVMGEWIVEDTTKSQNIRSVALRYFNPAGADNSLLIGELPKGKPSNLVPIITQSAAGVYGPMTITGSDFPTPDGTAIRDYIHVTDLAIAHLKALSWLESQNIGTFDYFNIGTGKGTSVYEMAETFVFCVEPDLLVCERGPRRPGDPAEVWCDSTKANSILGWESKFGVKDILNSAWEWEKKIRWEDTDNIYH